MTDDFRETLVKNIEIEEAQLSRTEARLRAMKSALEAYDREAEDVDVPLPLVRNRDNRFQGVRPVWKAIETVMKEHGGMMTRDNLEEELIAGGAMIGKPRSGNLRISIDYAIADGKLKEAGRNLVWAG